MFSKIIFIFYFGHILLFLRLFNIVIDVQFTNKFTGVQFGKFLYENELLKFPF